MTEPKCKSNPQQKTNKKECRCLFHHPATESEALDIFNALTLAKNNNDIYGVFINAMQLLTPCEATGVSFQFKKDGA